MKKKFWIFTSTILFMTSSVYADNNVEEKGIFDLGIRSALRVLTYEKDEGIKNSLHSDTDVRYCISLESSQNKIISPFEVVKMESLSLTLNYKPAYLQYSEDGESKNIFCFAMGDTKKEIFAKLVAIKSEYQNIVSYHPRIIKMSKNKNYKRAIPFLGIWSKDMTDTVGLLSVENARLKSELIRIKKSQNDYKEKVKNSILNLANSFNVSVSSKKSNSYIINKGKAVHIKSKEESSMAEHVVSHAAKTKLQKTKESQSVNKNKKTTDKKTTDKKTTDKKKSNVDTEKKDKKSVMRIPSSRRVFVIEKNK